MTEASAPVPVPVPERRSAMQRPVAILLGVGAACVLSWGTLQLAGRGASKRSEVSVSDLVAAVGGSDLGAAEKAVAKLMALPEERLRELIPFVDRKERTPLFPLEVEHGYLMGALVGHNAGDVVRAVLDFRLEPNLPSWDLSTSSQWAAAWDGLVAAKKARELATP